MSCQSCKFQLTWKSRYNFTEGVENTAALSAVLGEKSTVLLGLKNHIADVRKAVVDHTS